MTTRHTRVAVEMGYGYSGSVLWSCTRLTSDTTRFRDSGESGSHRKVKQVYTPLVVYK